MSRSCVDIQPGKRMPQLNAFTRPHLMHYANKKPHAMWGKQQ